MKRLSSRELGARRPGFRGSWPSCSSYRSSPGFEYATVPSAAISSWPAVWIGSSSTEKASRGRKSRCSGPPARLTRTRVTVSVSADQASAPPVRSRRNPCQRSSQSGSRRTERTGRSPSAAPTPRSGRLGKGRAAPEARHATGLAIHVDPHHEPIGLERLLVDPTELHRGENPTS